MVKKRGAEAVTKADLVEIVSGLETRLDATNLKIDGLRTELKGELGGVKDHIHILMSESVATNARMKAMEDRLTRKMDGIHTETTIRLEAFSSQMETLWRETITFPKILDEHGAALTGHDQRLKTLEARYSSGTSSAGPSGPQP